MIVNKVAMSTLIVLLLSVQVTAQEALHSKPTLTFHQVELLGAIPSQASTIYRARVANGWLVTSNGSRSTGGGLTFVPDAKHLWNAAKKAKTLKEPGEVDIQYIPEQKMVILRGKDADVRRLGNVIKEAKQASQDTNSIDPPKPATSARQDLESRWEYKVVTLALNATRLQDEINQISGQGWELVSILEENSTVIFKRRIRSE